MFVFTVVFSSLAVYLHWWFLFTGSGNVSKVGGPLGLGLGGREGGGGGRDCTYVGRQLTDLYVSKLTSPLHLAYLFLVCLT